MASTVVQPLADRLTSLLAAIGVTVPAGGWARDHLHALPAAEIEIPDGRRRNVDEPEDHLGQRDWQLEFPVTLWVDLHEASAAQRQLVELLEAWIAAVDADETLNNLATDAVVTSWQRVYDATDQARPLLGVVTTVEVLKFT